MEKHIFYFENHVIFDIRTMCCEKDDEKYYGHGTNFFSPHSAKADEIIFSLQDTYKAALLSAGSTKRLVQAVCKNEVKNGMAIVR